jgi:tight adherence protein C
LTPSAGVVRLAWQLDFAGNPAAWPVERVVSAKGISLVAGIVAGAAFGFLWAGPSRALLCGVLGALVGFFGPDLMIQNIAQKRQEEIRLTHARRAGHAHRQRGGGPGLRRRAGPGVA